MTDKKCRRICIKGDKIIKGDLNRGRLSTTRKPVYTDSETINLYLPSGICHSYELDESTCHLRTVRCLISFSFYFEYDFLLANSVDPKQTPSSVVSWSGPALFSYVPFYGTPDAYGLMQRFTMGDRPYHLTAPPGSVRNYFPRESANQIHLSYIYAHVCNVRRNKVSEFAYQFMGIQSIPDNASSGCI